MVKSIRKGSKTARYHTWGSVGSFIMRKLRLSLKKLLVVLMFIITCVVGMTFLMSTVHNSQSTSADVPLKTKVTLTTMPHNNAIPIVGIKQHIKKETPPAGQKDNDFEAEMDSNVRKRQVEKTCKKFYKQPNLFDHRPWDDKKIKLEKHNILHHLIVSEKHKVMYCFIPKIACSNMKRIFLVLNGVYSDVKHVNVSMMNREVTRLDNKAFKRGQVFTMFKNYYKFMLVRDPFERLVSAYRNKWLGKQNVDLHSTLGKMIVRRYRFNDSKSADPKGDDVKFIEYVRYLIDNPSKEVNEHWMSYHDLCRPCDVNYDFIGSIDTLSRDVSHAMGQINVDQRKYYINPVGKTALVGTKNVIANFLKQLPKKEFNALVEKFRFDHQLFGYEIPNYRKLHKKYNSNIKS